MFGQNSVWNGGKWNSKFLWIFQKHCHSQTIQHPIVRPNFLYAPEIIHDIFSFVDSFLAEVTFFVLHINSST